MQTPVHIRVGFFMFFCFSIAAISPVKVICQNIGIGKPNPLYKLDVTGSINTDSIYRIRGYPVLSISGQGNLFMGISSGNANSSGTYNTAAGLFSLNGISSGGFNSAIGSFSLSSNTVGSYNTSLGFSALGGNTTGSNNTAIGERALLHNDEGTYNVALGSTSLIYNTEGFYNIGIGSDALHDNTTGNFNTAIGSASLGFAAVSSYNTALGYGAGGYINMGWNNTLIGAAANVSFTGQYNSIAVGNLATCPDNSTVRIGNSSNWSYGAYANWTNISDERYKRNVKENVAGLDFIMRLRPVTYQMNVSALSKKLNEGDGKELNETMKLAMAEKEKMIWTGFMAQEVETAARATGFDFSGVDKPRNEYGVYGLRYAEFVVPLVKAVQELSRQNDELKGRIEKLETLLFSKN